MTQHNIMCVDQEASRVEKLEMFDDVVENCGTVGMRR
jgi:hypothetical protein